MRTPTASPHAAFGGKRQCRCAVGRDADGPPGEIAAETGNHERTWVQPADNKSTLTSVVVPINTSAGAWGQVEGLRIGAIAPQTLAGWLRYPSIILTVTMLTGGLLVFYLYLRRTLQHLDPKAAIPERIRTAFDALSEAVLIVDKQGYVILANASFRGLHPDAGKDHTGKPVDGRRVAGQCGRATIRRHGPWERCHAHQGDRDRRDLSDRA
jgi:PAS domain-containing protein